MCRSRRACRRGASSGSSSTNRARPVPADLDGLHRPFHGHALQVRDQELLLKDAVLCLDQERSRPREAAARAEA